MSSTRHAWILASACAGWCSAAAAQGLAGSSADAGVPLDAATARVPAPRELGRAELGAAVPSDEPVGPPLIEPVREAPRDDASGSEHDDSTDDEELLLGGLELRVEGQDPPVETDEPEEEKRVRFTGFPFIFYLPETNVGFGFGVSMSAKLREPDETSSMRWFPSTMTVGGAYTLNRQTRILITPEFYLGRGRIVVDGQTEIRFYPDRFYGLGGGTDEYYQDYVDRSFRSSTAVRYQLRRGIYLGGVVDMAVTRIRGAAAVDTDSNPRPLVPDTGWLGTGAVAGETESAVLGAGATFVFDNRDNPLMTQSGWLVRTQAVGFPGLGDLSNPFFRFLLDLRTYLPFADGNVVLAAQWFTSAVAGDAPFNHLAALGGPVGLRSFPDGRFRDSLQTFVQTELRFPIVWRIRGAAHLGTGTVVGKYSLPSAPELLWAAGIGLRVVLLPERRLTVRGDLVLGPEGVRVLAFVHEAF